MSNFIAVGPAQDIPEGESKSVEVKGRMIAIFQVGGKFYALDDDCPHQGGPLSEGTLYDCVVVCPWHGWRFDVRTGHNPEGLPFKVKSYPVQVVNGQILVGL